MILDGFQQSLHPCALDKKVDSALEKLSKKAMESNNNVNYAVEVFKVIIPIGFSQRSPRYLGLQVQVCVSLSHVPPFIQYVFSAATQAPENKRKYSGLVF